MSTTKNLTKKASLVGLLTLSSRFFALFREILLTRFLGANAASDAFFTALKIPNTLRKTFAEGALSTAFVPTVVQTLHIAGKEGISSLMSITFIIFECIVLLISLLIMYYAESVLWFIAGGFTHEQITHAVPWLRILMPFILFVSSSALIASTLQAIGAFFVPAFAPILLNIVLIIGLGCCTYYHLSINTLCFIFLIGGLIQLIWHLLAYWYVGFTFSKFSKNEAYILWALLKKFFMSLIGSGIEEINSFIGTTFASYLKHGSLSILRYANQFINIPLGVFVTALSTVLLPHFARIGIYAPKRLSFYVLEALKLTIWIMLPTIFFMGYFAREIFTTLFLSAKFSYESALQAGLILQILLPGLLFASFNRILRSIYFALHETKTPALIGVIGTTAEIMLSWYLLTEYNLTGLAFAISFSHLLQTILFVIMLRYHMNFTLYPFQLVQFIGTYALQLLCIGIPAAYLYQQLYAVITSLSPDIAYFLTQSFGFWFWVGSIATLVFYLVYLSRKTFNIKLHFLP